MMTIIMYCDRCGDEIEANVNGGVRVRTGDREVSLHLCKKHQDDLLDLVDNFCENAPPRNVKQPSLKGN